MRDVDLKPKTSRRHRPRTGPGLFVTDQEIIDFLGVPEKQARDTIRMLDRNGASGFPKKQPLWGDRRYWPAVQSFFDRLNGMRPRQDNERTPRNDR